MSREALMKFREGVLADEGLQQEIRELMEAGDVEKANAWVEEKGYTDVGFTTEEIVDFLENPGADVELSDLELQIVTGGYNPAVAAAGCSTMTACIPIMGLQISTSNRSVSIDDSPHGSSAP